MVSQNTEPFVQGALKSLKEDIHDYQPYLEQTGEWTIRDVHGRTPDNPRKVMPITRLRHWGVIEKLRREKQDTQEKPINVYQWHEEARQELVEYVERLETLPCGHRAHVYNDPEIDGLGCKHCAEEDKHPEYSRELVKERV